MSDKKLSLSILFLASFTAAITFAVIPIRYPELGLDESWQQALVEATDSGRIFGDDLVFTYGPFHQAVTSQASDHLSALLTSRALFASIWFGISVLIGFHTGLPSALAIAISAALLSAWDPGPLGDAKFYLFSLISIIASDSILAVSNDRLPLWTRTTLSILLVTGVLLSTLVKLSLIGAAIPAMLSIYGFQVFDLLRNPARKTIFSLLLSLAVPFLILYSAWGFFVGWLPQTIATFYFGLNLQIVAGYTDAMSYDFSLRSLVLVCLYWISILIILTYYIFLSVKAENPGANLSDFLAPKPFLSFFSILLLSWVCFKAAFVRDDGTHIVLAATFLLSFMILFAGFGWHTLNKIRVDYDNIVILLACLPLLGFLCMSLTIAIFAAYRPPNLISNTVRGFMDSVLMMTGRGREMISMNRRDKLKDIQAKTEDYRVSPGKSADIMPWDITNLLANQLVYNPRPIPQSYSAYTKSLQKANQDFFLSSLSRPEYVILEVKDINDRLPIGLDSAALDAIKSNYLFSHRGSRGSLVFKLNKGPTTSPTTDRPSACQLRDQKLTWNQTGMTQWTSGDIYIPKNLIGFMTLTLDLKDSPSRSLLSAVYRPFPVMIEYLDARKNIVNRFRLIPKAGLQIVVYPIIRDNQNLFYFMTSGSPVLASNPSEISSFRLRARSLGIPFNTSTYSLRFSC